MNRRVILAQELRSQLRRYVLVALSMLLGVLGLVGVALGNSVAADMLIAQEEQLNGREASFEATAKVNPALAARVADQSAQGLLTEIMRAVGNRIDAAAFRIELPARLRTRSETKLGLAGDSITTLWVLGDVNEMRRIPILDGRRSGDTCHPGELTINSAASSSLGIATGDSVTLELEVAAPPRSVVVSGVVADGQPNAIAFGSWELYECVTLQSVPLDESTLVFVMNPRGATTVEQLVTEALHDRGLSLEGGLRRIDTVEDVRSQIDILSTIFAICAGLLLVVSALGIASVGIAAVTERSRELLVRRAFGARRIDVFAQVLTGAALVGAVVGVVGFAVAIVITYALLPALLPVASSISAPAFPWSAGVLGLAAGISTGLLGGAVPAVKATRLPVAEALRR